MSDSVPKFPPRPSDQGSLIVSSLPDQLPLTLRTAPVAAPPPRRRRWPVIAGGALAALLVAGGVLWWSTGSAPPQPAPPPAAPAAEFVFARAPETQRAVLDSDCSAHAYGDTKAFLVDTPCAQLTRALFTTTTADGRTVHTSVAVVRMHTADDATRLGDLVRADGTGSVNDVLRDRVAVVPGLTRLSRGGFAATVLDQHVIIAESDTATPLPDPMAHKAEMKRVSTAALDLGVGLN
ncbi:hypothetical protein [Actinokineospora sp. UTMC 2448]|uniref:hypothetical protein n=1 Tax=Actinokineospora sp. UTMC 2448 TaxID=2268449 RepID=UPI0021646F72|nr:hypothetical protein [Actinokineospora sp. UTMC 2448]UVS80088.1 hypothetical protein Actkin_03838 [Actinokineospora sp. UTMC 2448]